MCLPFKVATYVVGTGGCPAEITLLSDSYKLCTGLQIPVFYGIHKTQQFYIQLWRVKMLAFIYTPA